MLSSNALLPPFLGADCSSYIGNQTKGSYQWKSNKKTNDRGTELQTVRSVETFVWLTIPCTLNSSPIQMATRLGPSDNKTSSCVPLVGRDASFFRAKSTKSLTGSWHLDRKQQRNLGSTNSIGRVGSLLSQSIEKEIISRSASFGRVH